MIIRPAQPGDNAAIRPLVTAAFVGADHASGTEADIVVGVRAEGAVLVELVAEEEGRIVGHVLFSRMTCEPSLLVAGLGPVAALPGQQLRGIGSALILEGLERCRALGVQVSLVLGHPPYYPRFGYSAAAAAKIASPFAGNPAFMALELIPGTLDQLQKADFPAAFG